jgi:hypothetical protein
MDKFCQECGDKLHGRIDKKYCSDQCRNAYNNRVKSGAGLAVVRKINGILARNRNILAELNPTGKTSVHKSKLQKKGFIADYITQIYTTRAGRTYYYCYDQGYFTVENDFCVLVRKSSDEL